MNDYKNLFYYSPIPTWVYDLETFEVLDVNFAAEKFSGHSREEFLTSAFTDFLLSLNVSHVSKDFSSSPWRNELQNNVYTFKKRNGEEAQILLEGQKINFDGKVCMMMCSVPKEAEQQETDANGLAEYSKRVLNIDQKTKEQKLRNFMETIPDLLCMTDLNGRFLEMNKNGCTLLGYTESEIVGSLFENFLHPVDREVFNAIMKTRQCQKKVFQLENRYITKTGEVLWFQWDIKIVSEEGRVYATAKNITHEKKLVEVVNMISRLAKTGGWEIDVIHNQLHWSQGVHEIHQTNADSFEPQLDEALDFYRNDYKEQVKNTLNKTLPTGKPFDFEAVIITALGHEKWIRAIGEAEVVDDKCVRVYGSFQDITSLKETEQRLQAISNDLPGVTFQYVKHPDGTDKMTFVSQKSREIWNLSPEDCEKDIHQIWDQIKMGGDYNRVQQDIQNAAENQVQWHSQWKNVLPIGRVCWHEGYGTPHKLADGTLVFNSMIFDVTERVRLNKLHKETTELAKMASWEQDFTGGPNKNITYWSPMVRKILEVDDNYNASFYGGLEFYTASSKNAVEQAIKELIDDGKECDLEAHLITQSGNEKWVRLIGKSERENGVCTKIYGSLQDIHSMKILQLRLEEILGSISDAFYAVDKDWRFTYFNKEAENLLGKKSEQVLGKVVWEQFAPAVGTNLETIYRRVAEQGIAERFEYFYPGTGSWYQINTYPSNGGVSAYFKNIDAERERAEKLQKAFDEKNRILESIGDAFFAVDKEWTVTYWNRQAERVLGKQRNAILGKNLWEEYPDIVKLKFYSNYHEAMATGEKVFFEEFRPASNTWFEVAAYPTGDGLSVYFKDITLRKQADLQIVEANQRFEKVTQVTADAIWDWDIANKFFYRSDGFDEMFGYKIEKRLSESEIWLDGYHPDDSLRIKSSIYKSLADPHQEFWQMKYRVVHHNGSIKTVIDKGSIIRNEEGEATRMIGAISDISARIKHEKDLKKLNKALKKNIRNLEITNEQLEQFAFIASHDLQEPLRMITSFLNQLQRKYTGKLDAKADQYIYFATDGAKRMKQIILDLLEYSRVGKELGNVEEVSLNNIIDQYIVLRSRLINEKSATIIRENLPEVTCFKAPLTQTIHCLLDNGIKYSKKGEAPQIKITVVDKKAHWQVNVEDNGIGIGSDFYEKVFIIFQRLHNRGTYEGTGMGLSIAKKNVESWGGEIWLESEAGKGTTFYFTIQKP